MNDSRQKKIYRKASIIKQCDGSINRYNGLGKTVIRKIIFLTFKKTVAVIYKCFFFVKSLTKSISLFGRMKYLLLQE